MPVMTLAQINVGTRYRFRLSPDLAWSAPAMVVMSGTKKNFDRGAPKPLVVVPATVEAEVVTP